MKKFLILPLLLIVFAIPAKAQIAAASGWCEKGGVKVTTQGSKSTTVVQASYPQCQVTVLVTGSAVPATIYADSGGSPRGNPFTANTDGSWTFYAATNIGYDIVMTGGTPIPFPTPFTIPDVFTGGGGGGGGGSGNVNNSGTPTTGQIALWVNATTIQGVNSIAQSLVTGLPASLALLAPIASPTFTGTVTLPSTTFSAITGSTQCLHVNSAGVISGSGADCASGGGITGLTPGFLPTAATSSTLADSVIDYNISNALAVTLNAANGLDINGTGGASMLANEGTPIAGAGTKETLSADTTTHRWVMNNNNTGSKAIPGTSTTAATAAKCVQYAANGYDLEPASAACSSGGGITGPIGPGYTFYLSSGTYYARNNVTGAVDYSGADAGPVIRSAIAANQTVCGHLYFNAAVYNINSLVAETAGSFSATDGFVTSGGTTIDYAIGLPTTGASSTQVCHWIIEGDGNQTILFPPLSGSTQSVNTNGVIFNITSTAISSVTAGNMIVGWYQRPQVSAGMNYEPGFITASNFGVRFPANTRGNETGIDFSMADYVSLDGILVDTNVLMGSLAYPTVGTLGMYGIATTKGGLAGTQIDNTYVVGYGTAYDVRGENSIIRNSWALASGDCMVVGARTNGISGFPYHANHFDHLSCAETKNGVTLSSQAAAGSEYEFTALDYEDATASFQIPFQPVQHFKEITDGNSWGSISYTRTVGGVGNVTLSNLFDGGGGSLYNRTTNGATVFHNTTYTDGTNNYTLAPDGVSNRTITGTDTFVRANGTLGANWGGGTHINVVSNAAGPDGTAIDAYAWYTAIATATNQYSQATVTVSPTTSTPGWQGVTVRQIDINNTYLFLAYGTAFANHRAIYKKVAGTLTLLAGDASNINSGDIIELDATGASPTTLRAFVNGVQILTTTDSAAALQAAGYAGIAFDATDTRSRITPFTTGAPNTATSTSGIASSGTIGGTKINTSSNCSSAASPAVCVAASAGSVVVAASATTVVVNTTAVSANSQILLQEDSSLGTKLSVTCNVTPATAPPTVSARTAATSFTITTTAPTTNPRCFSYVIHN